LTAARRLVDTLKAMLRRLCAGLWLCLAALPGAFADDVQGRVTSGEEAPVAGARVSLLSSTAKVAEASSASDGRFRLTAIHAGDYVLQVEAPGFSAQRLAVRVPQGKALEVRLTIAPVAQQVTVTALAGEVEEISAVSQATNVISASQMELRAPLVLVQAAQEEEGLAMQRTAPVMGGIFVRGLTGNKVNVFVDGVRYSTAAARGGVNTFLNLNSVSNLEAIEVLRGPNSAQYGSDSLGGTVQLLTLAPPIGTDGLQFHGAWTALASVADAGYGSSAQVTAGGKRAGVVANLDARRANRLRPGQGVDSHAAVTRFFGLPSDLFFGPRLPDTAFTAYGGMAKLYWTPATDSNFTAHYSRGQQDGGERYDQLLGGDGNLVADLRNLMDDFFYARFERLNAGWFTRASVGYSFNAQREERVNQGGQGNPSGAITHERERTSVHGVHGLLDKKLARHDLIFGAEYYHERVRAPAYAFDPVTGTVAVRRGRVPDNALYRSGGAYLQDVWQAIPQKLQFVGAVRYCAASYRARAADSPLATPLWPNDALRTSDVTFRAAVLATPAPWLSLYGNFSRGFRAPHITDLGTLGLTGSGFEVAAPEVAGLGATIGDSAAATALSTGRPVVQVEPETSMSYEGGVRISTRWLNSSTAVFVNQIDDNITKQALILPAGAVGTAIGGETITAQTPGGAVFVAAATNPVLVRANFDDARIWGVEHRTEVTLNARWSFGGLATYLHAADERTGSPPNIEGGTPAPDGYFHVRYSDAKSRWWVEPYLHAAARQDRLSTLDLEDRRTGAMRSAAQIANFFRRGATVRGWTGPGPDLAFGTPDDVLLATGETLAEVQLRVLGPGLLAAPLYAAVPGYVTFNLRGGVRLGERQSLMLDFSNIGDRSYRGISWGVDAPGRSLTVLYRVSF
jgi:outer membrane receptor protein involved in Fe transport